MRWSARSATAERFRDNGKVIFFPPSDLCVLICVGTAIRLRQFGGKLKQTVGGVVRSSLESLRIAVDLPWCMLLVSLVCLFFQWSVRRTCGFDGAFRWMGRPTNDRAPQVYIHPPPPLKIQLKHLPASQRRFIPSPLACWPWSLRRAIRKAAHASSYPCARLHF